MTTYPFTLTLATVGELTVEISDALFLAGVNGDDTLVGSRNGAVFVVFEREAGSLSAAVASAIDQVEKAGYRVAKVLVEEPAEVTQSPGGQTTHA
jgi:hypothetical protein